MTFDPNKLQTLNLNQLAIRYREIGKGNSTAAQAILARATFITEAVAAKLFHRRYTTRHSRYLVAYEATVNPYEIVTHVFNLPDLRPETAEALIFDILHKRLVDVFRAAERKPYQLDSEGSEVFGMAPTLSRITDPTRSGEASVEHNEEWAMSAYQVHRLIMSVARKELSILQCHILKRVLEGESTVDIAASLNLSRQKTSNHRFRAMEALRKACGHLPQRLSMDTLLDTIHDKRFSFALLLEDMERLIAHKEVEERQKAGDSPLLIGPFTMRPCRTHYEQWLRREHGNGWEIG